MQTKFVRKKFLSKNDSGGTLAEAGSSTSVCDRAANAHAFPQSSFVHWDVTVRVCGEEEEQERKEKEQSTVDNYRKILAHLSISFLSDLLAHKIYTLWENGAQSLNSNLYDREQCHDFLSINFLKSLVKLQSNNYRQLLKVSWSTY